jgi:hypothetical protein
MKKVAFIFFLVLTLQYAQAEIVRFSHEIKTRYSAQDLWQGLDEALIDSRGSNVWPSTSTVVGEGLVDGSVIEVTYSMGFFTPTYPYRISISPNEYEFSYSTFTQEHPFVGGATIMIVPQNQGAVLKWEGSYDTSNSSFFARRAFLNFERNFFRDLKRKLK